MLERTVPESMAAQNKAKIKELLSGIAEKNGAQAQGKYPPCPEAELRLYEQGFGRALPPSYRAFLSICNGWRDFSRGICLLGTRYRQEKDLLEAIEEFQALEALEGRFGAATGIFVAASPDGRYFLYYDIHTRHSNGEMELVEYVYPNGEVECYPDFVTYLEKHLARLESGGDGTVLRPELSEELRMVLIDAACGQELVAKRDKKALRALWNEKEWVRSSILQAMAISVGPWSEEDRQLLFEFKTELLGEYGPVDLRGLAIAAFLEYDLQLFDQVAARMGDNVAGLEFFANDFLQRGKYAEGLRVLMAVIESQEASEQAWLQLTEALYNVEIPAADAAALLLRAEGKALCWPELYQGISRVWLKLERQERAMEAAVKAVRGGVRLDELRSDAELSALHQDPEFNRLFLDAYRRENVSLKLNKRV